MSTLIVALLVEALVSPSRHQHDQRAAQTHPIAAPQSDEDEARPASTTRHAMRDEREVPNAVAAKSQDHDGDEAQDAEEEEGRAQPSSVIVVTARRLDAARTRIDAGLGATIYELTNDTIENRPGGETGRVSDVLTQAPGVTLSGRGLNVRGSRANQVRINNVIVPEAIADPAEHLSSRLAETTALIAGTLPAQFGFAPGGVISITTKNGLYQHGGQAELFAGTDGAIEPALEWAGSVAGTSMFVSGSFEHNRATLADAPGFSARERRTEIEGFAFADHVIDANNRVSFILGGSRERHDIGQTSLVPGTEQTGEGYAVGSLLHSEGGFTVQSALFVGVASDRAMFSAPTQERRSTLGAQIDAAHMLGESHMLRFGLLASRSIARELDLVGDRSRMSRTSASLYAQDAWTLLRSLTFNPGARLEWLRGFESAPTIEPRASFVWQRGDGFTARAGYARYASASALGSEHGANALPDERDDYFDAGIQQRLGAFTLGIDGYSRSAWNYLAERETPGSAVSEAFGYRRALIRGVEFSGTYAYRGTTAWANIALSSAKGKTIIGGAQLFAPLVIAASSHYCPLGGDRPVTISGGLTLRFGSLSLAGDVLVSSGAVRTPNLAHPNGGRHPLYTLLGLAAVYHARLAGQPVDLRMDLTNLADTRYLLADATSLEGGWTRNARGRAITIGIEQGF